MTEDFCFDICLDKYHAFASLAQILNIDDTSKSENMIRVPLLETITGKLPVFFILRVMVKKETNYHAVEKMSVSLFSTKFQLIYIIPFMPPLCLCLSLLALLAAISKS